LTDSRARVCRWVRLHVAGPGQEDVRAGRGVAGQRARELQGPWIRLDGWIRRGDQLRRPPKLDSSQKGAAHTHSLSSSSARQRACLAQLNFTSKAVFLENSFMSDFLDEAELFWKKCLTK